MLNNPLGVLLYILLRNDISWKLLSPEEKERVLEANRIHNTGRDDYVNPEKYAAEGRKTWDSLKVEKDDHRGQTLIKLLEQNKPKRVLEIGPGEGFYTRLICQYHTVDSYTAIDINRVFLDYLEPRLERVKQQKQFSYTLICGNATETELQDKYDLIVLFSSVHHIPDRIDLFNRLSGVLAEDGTIFCFDPSHYIYRVRDLAKKCVRDGYLKREFYLDKNNLSTHHFCSYGEYKKIAREINGLKIDEVFHKLPDKVKKYDWLFVPNRWFSTEIGIVLRKANGNKQ